MRAKMRRDAKKKNFFVKKKNEKADNRNRSSELDAL